MTNYTIDDISQRMAVTENIRTMSVIAHVDHGKTTLTDCLLSTCGLLPEHQAGEICKTDTGLEEIRGITIKSTAVSLCYDRVDSDEKGDVTQTPHLIHLIDSPGHVDFSSEVTAALRITDGALVVVDCVEGVCVQTETVLRQAIVEGIKPCLFINKMDRIFLELQMDLEEAYLKFRNTIEHVNRIVATYSEDESKFSVSPELGTVGFGSGLHNWAFTLDTFAEIYAEKSGLPRAKWMKWLWGDHFYDLKRGVWTKKRKSKDGKENPRGFCYFVLKPIREICKAIMVKNAKTWNKKKLEKLKESFGLIYQDKDLEKAYARRTKLKDVLKFVLSHWLKCGETLLNMICDHLPSPLEAQQYRVRSLYGPLRDTAATSIAKCDKDGAVMFYVSKMIPMSAKGRFYCLGRLFSGTLKPGPIRILSSEFDPSVDPKKGLVVGKLQRAVTMMIDEAESLDAVPCGNIVALVGVDRYIKKNATLTDCEDAYPLKSMKFSVSAVVRRRVEVRRAQDRPKLVAALRDLANSENLLQVLISENGENIIAGAGELHLETALYDLQHTFMKGVPIVVSEPIVSYCESIIEETKEPCLAKSRSKLNRIWAHAKPLGEELCDSIENGEISASQDKTERGQILMSKYDWGRNEVSKILGFGNAGSDGKCNVLVNGTTAAQYLNEVKDSIVSGFMLRTESGVLCEEPLRGIKFDIHDVKLHSDPAHRKAGEILPTTSRVLGACQLAGKPCILEPVYAVSITVPREAMSGVYNTVATRRGQVTDEKHMTGTPLVEMKAFLPVAESFGFDAQLRGATRGQAFPQMSFSHWQRVSGDVYEDGSPANTVVMQIRKRKGLSDKIPTLEDFNDRL